MLYQLARPLLFCQEPEVAHERTLKLLKKISFLMPEPSFSNLEPVQAMGLHFPNRVGLAAGLDKNATHVKELGKLGFGFLEVGTVTPVPQAGNPKPRLFRLPEQRAIINRMGFNNEGVDSLITNVISSRASYNGILGINIGKNKDTPNEEAVNDYLLGLRKVYSHADYITVNISSPNTLGLRALQQADSIKLLLEALKLEQIKLAEKFGYRPIAIKIAPDLEDYAIIELAEIFKQFEVDGVIATNTTIDRTIIKEAKFANEKGGLSGAPIKKRSTHVITVLASCLNDAVPIIGVGGILSGYDALEKLQAGAKLVQIYSGLIFQGPSLIQDAILSTSQI